MTVRDMRKKLKNIIIYGVIDLLVTPFIKSRNFPPITPKSKTFWFNI